MSKVALPGLTKVIIQKSGGRDAPREVQKYD